MMAAAAIAATITGCTDYDIQIELVSMNMSLIEREKCLGLAECVRTKATDSVITKEAKNLERPSDAVKKQ